MKNQEKRKLSLKKLTVTRLQPGVIAKFRGGDCPPTQHQYYDPCECTDSCGVEQLN